MVTMQGHGSVAGPTNKITKARSKVVKPILKKLSYSEKGSLDLDRGWEDQQQVGGLGGVGVWEPVHVGTGRSAKDVSFSFGTAGARGSSGVRSVLSGKEGVTTTGISSSSSGNVVRKTFQQHGRSHSGNSVATNGSGGGGMRAGSFVHPFQQMPRTSTPPLSYANSLASSYFDNTNNSNNSSNAPREYSPTITENEDDGDSVYTSTWSGTGTSLPPHLHLNLNHQTQHHASFSFSSGHQPTLSTHSSTFSQTGLRRPSLASQRTSSLTDITSALTSPPQLRASTTGGRSTPRLLAPSKSDLHLNLTLSELESPVGSSPSGTPTTLASATATAASLASPTQSTNTTTTPMSPLRTSLEAMGTRLRSRSEVDSAARQEHIRQARRKFEERERVKEAKYEREEVERRNRQATKEAERIEKETREWYKATGVSSGVGVGGVGVLAGRSTSSLNVVNLHLSESVVLQAPAPCAARPGRPSVSRMTTAASSIDTSASAPTHATGTGRSVVGAGVFGGKKKNRGKGSSAGTAGSQRPSDVFATTGGYSSNGGGSSSRKNSGFVVERSTERQANVGDAEKGIAGYARKYDALPDANDIPRFGAGVGDDDARNNWRKDRPRRASMAKKKTQTYWQGFVLWLRTKIFRLSKR